MSEDLKNGLAEEFANESVKELADALKKVNAGSNKTDSYATIETAVDFEKLETVLVITQ